MLEQCQYIFSGCNFHLPVSIFLPIIPVSYTHLDVYKRQVSTLHMISGNCIVSGFADGKPTSFTVDTGATVSIVRTDLISNRWPQISSCTIQTVTGSPVKVLGKVDVRVRRCV